MVGPLSSNSPVRSLTHTSPARADPIIDSSRRRTGSPTALNMREKFSARPASIGARTTDAANAAADGSPIGGRLGIPLAWQIRAVLLKSARLKVTWENPQ